MAETRDWTAELRERVLRYVHTAVYGDNDGSNALRAVERIMADVEVFGVLKAREGFARGWKHFNSSPDHQMKEDYPLPQQRTRRALREEPVPGTTKVLYRVQDGVLQQSFPHLPGHWEAAEVSPRDFALMRHALNLHLKPWRSEEVPADENNPWPEVEP